MSLPELLDELGRCGGHANIVVGRCNTCDVVHHTVLVKRPGADEPDAYDCDSSADCLAALESALTMWASTERAH